MQLLFIENVVMTDSAEQAVSRTMGVQPLRINAGELVATERPRLFWTNIPVNLPARFSRVVFPSDALDPGWKPLWEFESNIGFDDQTFCTFLRPFGPGAPPEFPADFMRLPLSQYSRRGLVYNSEASKEELSEVKKWVSEAVDISTVNIKSKGSPAQRARGRLATWIHREGGSRLLRPLRAHERDKALGFPGDASALDSPELELIDWTRLEANGNCFSPVVIAQLLGPVKQYVETGSIALRPGGPSVSSRHEALLSLLPAEQAESLNIRH